MERHFGRFLSHTSLFLELLLLQGDDPSNTEIQQKESTLRLLEDLIQEGLADEDDMDEYRFLLAELRGIYIVKQQFPITYKGKPSKSRREAGCYQRQISGVSENLNFKAENVKFDGFLSYIEWKERFSLVINELEGNVRSGVLLDAKRIRMDF